MNRILCLLLSISSSAWACDEPEEEEDTYFSAPAKKTFGLEVTINKPVDKIFVTKPEHHAYLTIKLSGKINEYATAISSYNSKSSDMGAGIKFEF